MKIIFPIFMVMGTIYGQRQAEVVATIEGDAMYRLLPPDAIPAIRSPEFLSASEADKQMKENEPVLGIKYNSDARAYSMWQLDAHEIVNDEIGGTPVAVTW